uniref:Uncharacterized protein n=1 Tax=Streptomyces avermitilis TaxID=33903 RepID=A0A499UZH3_STRAX|nr:hypothetical protein SAVMC3_01320 [Streptomyces avermitilis]
MLDRGLVAQSLLDHVLPGAAALPDVGELARVGQQGGDGLVDDVDGGLVPGADHQQECVTQLGVAEGGAVFLVAGGDQQ